MHHSKSDFVKRQSSNKVWIFNNQRMEVHLTLVAECACNDKYLKGLDLAAAEINGKTSTYFGEERNRSKKFHTDLRQTIVFCRFNMVYFFPVSLISSR